MSTITIICVLIALVIGIVIGATLTYWWLGEIYSQLLASKESEIYLLKNQLDIKTRLFDERRRRG